MFPVCAAFLLTRQFQGNGKFWACALFGTVFFFLFQQTRNWSSARKIGSRVAPLLCCARKNHGNPGVGLPWPNKTYNIADCYLKIQEQWNAKHGCKEQCSVKQKKTCCLALFLGRDTKQIRGNYAHGEQCIAFSSENNLLCFLSKLTA